MKPLFPMLLLAAALATNAQTQAPAASRDVNAQKARALVQQTIQALGGQAYLTCTDIQQQGRTYGFSHGESAGVGAPFWRFWKWPDKERLELLKHREWIIIYNGDQASDTTYHGTLPVEAEQLSDYLRRREYSLEYVLRRWINEPGVAFFYEGSAVADEKPAEKVTLVNARNQSVTLYISTDTHLPIRKTFQWRDPQDRYLNEEAESWDNYRLVQGIMTPFSITRSRNGQTVNQRFLNKVKYNQGFPDSMFTVTLPPPKKK